MIQTSRLTIVLILLCFTSCRNSEHFISDKGYRNKVEIQFEKQKKLAEKRTDKLFSVFNQNLTNSEEEALKFLFAYMPLSDLADYDGDFYLRNVRATFAARDSFSWGNKIPEIIFRHFVLPVRVNNENLDSSRWVFFSELRNRIRNLPMKDAVLEVNHWCHEKVTYRGSDGRTSSPLATVKTAFGRCGEESTFLVAALRSVGIPARQCYTPRWAHTDDNHAWVEVWVDGHWHFTGACEPEPELDMAWFTGPAKRAMLVNTNVFGDYEGPEDVLIKDDRFTRINILSNYTKTRKIVVRVSDTNNRIQADARVEFQLYNYAEFYPLHYTVTDKNGLASFQTGFGNLMIRVAKNGLYGFRKLPSSGSDTVNMMLDRKPGTVFSEEFDLLPPPEQKVNVRVSDSLKKINSMKLAFEDKLRASYESTFIDSAKVVRLAKTLKTNPDSLWLFLKQSRGNWRELIVFLSETPNDRKHFIFPLLSSLTEKDLRDVEPDVLADHILYSIYPEKNDLKEDFFIKYILCPRVDNEQLKPYKKSLTQKFEPSFIRKSRENPAMIADWIKSNILIDSMANYSRTPLTPIGVIELGVSDDHSRDIFFVALCRSFGIPSRLEPGTGMPQYFSSGRWIDVFFKKSGSLPGERGKLILSADAENTIKPEYYVHFTLEKHQDGFFRSLDFESDPALKSFPSTLELSPGYYALVSGNRIEGGTVLVRIQYFNIYAGKKGTETIRLRKNKTDSQVFGTLDLPEFFSMLDKGKPLNIDKEKGIIMAWITPGNEPSRHFIAELKMKKTILEKWGGNIILFFKSHQEELDFLAGNRHDMPSTVQYLTVNYSVLKHFAEALKQYDLSGLPVVSYITPRGEVRYLSEGYRIGIGNDLIVIIQEVLQ